MTDCYLLCQWEFKSCLYNTITKQQFESTRKLGVFTCAHVPLNKSSDLNVGTETGTETPKPE